ncbi:hypothetical protein KM043_013679 [Ampulex compressa]|nr:hypothetical protein KM043_013679 [Ampulex compressa]
MLGTVAHAGGDRVGPREGAWRRRWWERSGRKARGGGRPRTGPAELELLSAAASIALRTSPTSHLVGFAKEDVASSPESCRSDYPVSHLNTCSLPFTGFHVYGQGHTDHRHITGMELPIRCALIYVVGDVDHGSYAWLMTDRSDYNRRCVDLATCVGLMED